MYISAYLKTINEQIVETRAKYCKVEYKKCINLSEIILTWYRRYRDHQGGSPRKRLFHCTSVELTPANAPNVGISGTQFISVGDCVRAIPCKIKSKKDQRKQ